MGMAKMGTRATPVRLNGLELNRVAELQLPAVSTTLIILLFAVLFWSKRSRPVYLVDFSCYKPDDELKASVDKFLKVTENRGLFQEDSFHFQKRIANRACIGDETYLPRGVTSSPPNLSFDHARAESESVIFGALDSLFAKTGVNTSDVRILVVNCSLFNPVPSLSSMIVNRYKLRTDIKTYNLGGMGCSASLISVELGWTILKGYPNSYAVVVSTESITHSWYSGKNRSMLLTNSLFRMGASALLLSNKARDRSRSKYELTHLVRTHTGSNDKHFNCVRLAQDDEGKVGVSLSKEVMFVAGEALKTNIATLGPLVLPWKEQFKYFVTLLRRKILKANVKPYVPDFKLAFKHFCFHPGGRAVMDEIQNYLQLDDCHMEPSRMTLHRFGNTSSSSIWYELAYIEGKGRVKRGDQVWQVAVGSGYKCASAVWRALGDISLVDDWRGNAWVGSIDNYPVKLG